MAITRPCLSVPANTALISYWLGAESAYAWVVVPEAIRWTRLSSPEEISKLAREFHRSLSRTFDVPVEVRLQDSRALSGRVLAPIESQLGSAAQWVFIPDGALDYVPFTALTMSEVSGCLRRRATRCRGNACGLDAGHAQRSCRCRRRRARCFWWQTPCTSRMTRVLKGSGKISLRSEARQILLIRAYSGCRSVRRKPPESPPSFPGAAWTSSSAWMRRARGCCRSTGRNYRFIHIATHGIVDAQVPRTVCPDARLLRRPRRCR